MNLSRPCPGQIRGRPVRDGMAQQLWEQGQQQAAILRRPGLVNYIFKWRDLAGAARLMR
ncbi:hypothetical protein KBZ15_06395 [Cyanobium sp. BA20m-p-22]|uniref:hypothetical protein n=1 Tax=Cyanobium sp. BA20m-p-22 TaxID=2823704 RepID=UPI0020CB6A61|nr:hypothetical protein [Cyanobium sp. BA20m-p-22]MCP9909543.1 hypothetical protein [Cyanobium sp. BA20m-p-22]